jgi:hypothetical protein
MRTYGALREKIRAKFGTIGAFAEAMGKDRSTISQKLNGLVSWTQDEMELACDLLDFPRTDIPKYFFYEE